MAVGVLERTPEADLAASVTGHLGPDAPAALDGVIYVGVARRDPASSDVRVERILRHTLSNKSDAVSSPLGVRHERQEQAAVFVLQAVRAAITQSD
jgi:nicotinamide mononucleotide (NMN) deamidase PncC